MEVQKRSLQPKAAEAKIVKQLNIRQTNIVLKCNYPLNQMDNRKVIVMFNATKYFEIKCYVRDYPLTLYSY